jgi:hypothetical protein
MPLQFDAPPAHWSRDMTEADYARKLADLDRLLNDPDVPMQPARVWALLAEIAQRGLANAGATQPRGGRDDETAAAPNSGRDSAGTWLRLAE